MQKTPNLSARPIASADRAASTAAVPKTTIELKGLCKGYGDDWAREEVIADCNLTMAPGTLTAVVGPSGCGKTTLVNLVAGFEKPDKGEIFVNGKRIDGPGHDRMVVFQESALLPWLTAYQNVVFGPKLRGDIGTAQLKSEANRLLGTVGLADFKDKYPLQLSGGMQRRAELARALINNPLLLIMDEPFRGLDAMSRRLMQEFFLRLFEENRRTNLFVTSEIEEATFLADRLVVLSNKPAQVRKVIDITLPRPRNLRMLSAPEAYDIRREAMEILHEEVVKTFKAGGAGADFIEAYRRRGA
jgi:NitT/TauT family transport system ATP-binding protein